MKAGLKYSGERSACINSAGASGKKQNSGGLCARRCLRIYFKR